MTAVLFAAASCSKDPVAGDEGTGAQVSLRLVLPDAVRVITKSADNDDIDEPELPDMPADTLAPVDYDDSSGTVTPGKDTIRKVWFVVADSRGNVLDKHYSRVAEDNSCILIEGMRRGRYIVAVLASTGDGNDVRVTVPSRLSECWFTTKDGNPLFSNDFFYKEVSLEIGPDQKNRKGTVELERCLTDLRVHLDMGDVYMRRFVKDVRIVFDEGTKYGEGFNADGTVSEGGDMPVLDAARDSSFKFLPFQESLSGRVEVLSVTSDSTRFTRSYRFSGLKAESGKVARIKVAYTHPEQRNGEIYVREADYAYLPYLDTMFLSDENASVYYRMNNSARQFKVAEPLQVSINGKRLYVKLFSPKPVTDVTIRARFNNISSKKVTLAHFDVLYPFMEAYFDLPVTSRDCVFSTEDGRRMEIPAMEDFSSASVTLEVDTGEDPYMKMIKTIRGNWQVLFDHVSYSWSHEMTPSLCRNAVALVTNMAYMFSSQYFEDVIKPVFDAGEICTVSGDKSTAISYDTIKGKVRGYNWIRCGNCGGYGGMGSAAFYWLAPYCWTNHYYDVEENQGPETYSRQAIFHEFGHVIGYGHSSDMTYGNGMWWKTCARIYCEMGRKGLLPVNRSGEVSGLPM